MLSIVLYVNAGVHDGAVVCRGPSQLRQVVRALAARVVSAGAATEVRRRGRSRVHVPLRDLQQPGSLLTHAPDGQLAQSTHRFTHSVTVT